MNLIVLLYKSTSLKLVSSLRLLFILVTLTTVSVASAQSENVTERRVIQFTGVVFTSDSATVIPGVHVYVPKGGRGTTTNPYGFFSMPVLEGDSVVFSAIGFQRSYFIVPEHDKDYSLRLLMYINEDVTYLQEVEIFPYPSEATFKAAVLAAELPNQREVDEINRWLNSDVMTRMYQDLPYSASMNHRFFEQQQIEMNNRRYGAQANPLLNPFAWASFIRSLKNR